MGNEQQQQEEDEEPSLNDGEGDTPLTRWASEKTCADTSFRCLRKLCLLTAIRVREQTKHSRSVGVVQ